MAVVQVSHIYNYFLWLSILFQRGFKSLRNALSTCKRAYRNSWTLDARVERCTLDPGCCTLDAGLWTLDSGLSILDTVVDCCRTESESSFWFCLIKLLKILWVRISKDHGHACSLETIGSDVTIFRNSILTLSFTSYKNAERNFYCEKSNYITSIYLGLLRSSRPQSPIFENFSRKYRW